MNTKFYKMRRNRMVSGVLAGLSDKWNFDVTLVRFLFAIFTVANFGVGVIIYIILASILPTKEDIEAGKMNKAMIIGKGSLFLGRMTNLFDGVSFVIQANTSADSKESGVSEEEVKGLIAKAMKEFAASLVTE